MRKNQVFPCRQRLPDGSHLSKLHASSKHRRRDDGLAVRAVEYRPDEVVPGAEPLLYRLITTLRDPAGPRPAAELAALCHERWETGTAFAELKTSLPGGGRLLLRSGQDARAGLAGVLRPPCSPATRSAARCTRPAQAWAAARTARPFIHAVRIARRNLPRHAAFSPAAAP